jgi:hypothetical protein
MISEKEYKDKLMAFPVPLADYNRIYIDMHWDRFMIDIAMLEENVILNKDSVCLELGSPIPYISYSMFLKYNCKVVCRELLVSKDYEFENIKVEHFNICTSEFKENEFDLVILTEVLEHLPCNMLKARDKVIASIKDGGYLLVSYPCKGENPVDYDKDIYDYNWDATLEHIRDFTLDTARTFITNLAVVTEKTIISVGYRGLMHHILYRKVPK